MNSPRTISPIDVQQMLHVCQANGLLLTADEEDFVNVLAMLTAEDADKYTEADAQRLKAIIDSLPARQLP